MIHPRILVFELDDDTEDHFAAALFYSEPKARARWEYRTAHHHPNDEMFVFEITKLPRELMTIWKGGYNQGWEYPLEYQYHVAATYLTPYDPAHPTKTAHKHTCFGTAPRSMSDVEQRPGYPESPTTTKTP